MCLSAAICLALGQVEFWGYEEALGMEKSEKIPRRLQLDSYPSEM